MTKNVMREVQRKLRVLQHAERTGQCQNHSKKSAQSDTA